MSRATHSTTRDEALQGRAWWVVDAADQTVGRLATRIASILKGKHKPSYTPSLDTGDFVVVVNAGKVRFTGKKESEKLYFTHTMHPGGSKLTPAEKLRARNAAKAPAVPAAKRDRRAPAHDILGNAVRRMLPRNALGRKMMGKLKIYAGETHPHVAQKPQALGQAK